LIEAEIMEGRWRTGVFNGLGPLLLEIEVVYALRAGLM
jgi:hypothetical protein